MTRSAHALGIMQLQIPPNVAPGSLSNPSTYPFPIICRQVPGAFVANTVAGGPEDNLQAWIDTAKALVRAGAAALTSTCGFAIKFQRAIAQAVNVPVSASSLLLLPYLLAAVKGRTAVLTFDSRPLTFDLLKLAGVTSPGRVAIAGIENTESWVAMSRPENDYTVDQLAIDVVGAVAKLRQGHPDIEAILFECAGFPVVAPQVREQTGLPVFDAVTNAKLLMSAMA